MPAARKPSIPSKALSCCLRRPMSIETIPPLAEDVQPLVTRWRSDLFGLWKLAYAAGKVQPGPRPRAVTRLAAISC